MTDDAEEDPFEELEDDVADRDGDPFADLDADSEQSPADEQESEPAFEDELTHDPTVARPGSQPGQPAMDNEAPSTEESASDDPVEDGEASEMAFGVGREKTVDPDADPFADAMPREGDPFEPGGAFETMDVADLDPDQVWQDLTSAESRGSVGEPMERTYADVSKHAYCEQCEHFSPPPDIECHHEGTEIVEFVDMEKVRVMDCPIVAEREQLKEAATSMAESDGSP